MFNKYCLQKRCGWRPGHISNRVLQKIAAHRGKCGICPGTCTGICGKSNAKPCTTPPKCSALAQQKKKNNDGSGVSKSEHSKPQNNKADPYTSDPNKSQPYKTDPNTTDPNTTDPYKSEPFKTVPSCKMDPSAPSLRVIRHAGRYSIITDPADNSPSGPYPLKYVLNYDPSEKDEGIKFSLEAKYNDYCFDYTSSQTSFVLDFSPPEPRCYKPCPKDPCVPCIQSCLAPC